MRELTRRVDSSSSDSTMDATMLRGSPVMIEMRDELTNSFFAASCRIADFTYSCSTSALSSPALTPKRIKIRVNGARMLRQEAITEFLLLIAIETGVCPVMYDLWCASACSGAARRGIQ